VNSIEKIQEIIAQDRFRIHTICKHSLEQIQTYSWDKKKQEQGIDYPLKSNDYYPDM
jgi:hypothetical protein